MTMTTTTTTTTAAAIRTPAPSRPAPPAVPITARLPILDDPDAVVLLRVLGERPEPEPEPESPTIADLGAVAGLRPDRAGRKLLTLRLAGLVATVGRAFPLAYRITAAGVAALAELDGAGR